MKETWLIISERCKELSYGVMVNGELNYLDISFFNNVHNRGFVVITPDGDIYGSATEVNNKIEESFMFEGKKITIQFYPDDQYVYECCIIEE